MFGVQPSLYELQISLLCPITCQAASAVGHSLACTIAKLGVFKALNDSTPVVGPVHYMQCVHTYKAKWLKSYRPHQQIDMFNEVIHLFTQPLTRSVCVRSPELISWASECVIDINHVYTKTNYTLKLLLPRNWRNIINQSVLVNNQARTQQLIQPKAKVARMLIGIVKQPRPRTIL